MISLNWGTVSITNIALLIQDTFLAKPGFTLVIISFKNNLLVNNFLPDNCNKAVLSLEKDGIIDNGYSFLKRVNSSKGDKLSVETVENFFWLITYLSFKIFKTFWSLRKRFWNNKKKYRWKHLSIIWINLLNYII